MEDERDYTCNVATKVMSITSRCYSYSFSTVDQEFDTVSGFLLKRTKDMVNKYRQLLVREAQVRLSWTAAGFYELSEFSLRLPRQS